jgi:hypothetical protein
MAFNQDESSYTEHGRRIPRPSHNFVPEYQMSGVPYVKKITLAGVTKVSFDHVTRWIIIKNPAGNNLVKLGFNATGVAANNYYLLEGDLNQTAEDGSAAEDFTRLATETPRLEVKCKEIYLSGTNGQLVYVIAGLTNVMAEDFPDQTAANGFTGVEA